MATAPRFYNRTPEMTGHGPRTAAAARAGLPHRSPYALRALPNEDVFFYSKTIDNSRVVREAGPRSRTEWSAIGAACLVAALLVSMLVPSVGSIMAGYKLQALKQEHQRLLDEQSVLELAEARLLNPARLEQLAKDQQLVAPAPGQVIHLDPKNSGSLASVKNISAANE